MPIYLKSLAAVCVLLLLPGCRGSKPATPNSSAGIAHNEAAPSNAVNQTSASDGKQAPFSIQVKGDSEDEGNELFGMKPNRSYQIPRKSSVSTEASDSGLLEFLLPVNKGQYIRVNFVTESPAPQFAAGMVNGLKINSLTPSFCKEGMYPIPQDGNLRFLLFNHGGDKYPLQFTTFEATDPLVDPGIKPEQIDFNLYGFGPVQKIGTIPYDLACEPADSWPASVQIDGKRLHFRIAQVAGYKELFPHNKDIDALIASFKPSAKPLDAKELPYSDGQGEAATVMTARPEIIEGDGWRGWRWVEGNSQDGDYPGGLMYVFEGLTKDNQLFFRVTSLINHPDVKRLEPAAPSRSDDNFGRAERLQLEKALAVAAPSSFQPNLTDLDAVVRSLKFRR